MGGIGKRAPASERTASVRLEVGTDGPCVGLSVVVAIDVKLQEHQQAVQPLAVLERVATRVERRGDRTGELLERSGGARHVGRPVGASARRAN